MTTFTRLAALCVALLLWPGIAAATTIIAKVNVSQQSMTVYHNGQPLYTWPVSTARSGKWTPRGSWTAQWLSEHHRSSRYNNAPMPYSIFYSGHYAIHGTNQTARLGQPASAGCIRLHPDNAAVLFRMTQEAGLANMRVVVEN